MSMFLAALLLTSSPAEIPADVWLCKNQIEVWCTVDSCAAKAASETTPMSIAARRDGAVSVCAYTGCWEGEAATGDIDGRLTWAAQALPFSSQPDGGFEADVSLFIIEKDGVGFVRVGGIASPLLCVRSEPGE